MPAHPEHLHGREVWQNQVRFTTVWFGERERWEAKRNERDEE
jgi:hypothetical protein